MKPLRILALLFFCCASAAATAQASAELQSVPFLDVQRYLGRWHEIARFPNRFQQKCVGDTSADYSLRPDGTLSVLNQCRLSNGRMEQALGVARQIGGQQSAKLQVRFAPAWLSFLPVVWGNYWVIDLDEHYELVAVSEPRREYLWILSRTPTVDEARYRALIARLQAMGLDVSKLQRSVRSAQ